MGRAAGIVSRVLAALLGGWLLTFSAVGAAALWLPASNAHAVYATGSLAFVVWTVAVLVAFAARSAGRAWLWMLLPTFGLAIVALPRLLGRLAS
ncbi:MAG: hypothetical protein QM661_07415 [Solimonas sp.]